MYKNPGARTVAAAVVAIVGAVALFIVVPLEEVRPVVAAVGFVSFLFVAMVWLARPIVMDSAQSVTRVVAGAISSVLPVLANYGTEGAFVSFRIPPKSSRDSRGPVDLQFSTYQGQPGLDWVLLATQNVEDEEMITGIASEKNIEFSRWTENGIDSLRVEDPTAAGEMAESILRLYGVGAHDAVELAAVDGPPQLLKELELVVQARLVRTGA